MRQGNGGDEQPREEVRKVFVEHECLLPSSQGCLSRWNPLSCKNSGSCERRKRTRIEQLQMSDSLRSASQVNCEAVRFWRHLFLEVRSIQHRSLENQTLVVKFFLRRQSFSESYNANVKFTGSFRNKYVVSIMYSIYYNFGRLQVVVDLHRQNLRSNHRWENS